MSGEEILKEKYNNEETALQNSFVISLISGIEARKNMFLTIDIENVLNKNLNLNDYTNGSIENITITAISPYNGNGVNWKERKLYKRKQKKLIIDIVFEKYEQFCEANKKEALELLAKQTIHATEKYMPKIKEIDYEAFHKDLIEILHIENIINKIEE